MQIKGLVFKQRQLDIIKKHFGIENKSFDEKKPNNNKTFHQKC